MVVTGAGHRVGFAIARKLLISGYNIIAHYRNNRSELDNWLDSNESYKECVRFIQADLTESTIEVTDIIQADRSIFALINSASVFESGDLLDNDSLQKNIAINTMVPLALAKSMKGKNAGVIINIIDANIKSVNTHYQSYRMSKLFLQEITRQLAVTMGPSIRVNGVAPGTVLPPEGAPDESYLNARKKAPLERDASLDDVLHTVLFLLENNSITGEIIAVDCGVHAV